MNTLFEIYDLLVETEKRKAKKKSANSPAARTARDTQGNMFVHYPDIEDGNENITEANTMRSKQSRVRNKRINRPLHSEKRR